MIAPSESERLTETMLQAFDNQCLERMLNERLDKKIVDLIPNKELMTYVVKAAAAAGWTEDLIKAALIAQPDSQALRRLAVFEPLTALIHNHRSKKSPDTGGEIARVVSHLLKVLNQTPPHNIKPETFSALHNELKDLYSEHARLSEGITAS